jgi:putative chitinase
MGTTATGTLDRKIFFDAIRADLFGGWLVEGQVQGIGKVLDEAAIEGMTDLRKVAYIFATDYHETGRRMQPINEEGGAGYFFRMYDMAGERPDSARELGNDQPGDGVRYHGRGYVMITGRRNYRKMGSILGLPLEASPELALDPDAAMKIMFEGMLRKESGFGDFTGAALEDYFTATSTDWVHARRIVNGMDRAQDIAGYAQRFYSALQAASGGAARTA